MKVFSAKRLCRILALSLALLAAFAFASIAESHAPLSLSANQYYAVNLFLSNFTELSLDHIAATSEDQELVDFAHDHLWFNAYDSFEYGEYENENNCRVSDDRIQQIVDKYFFCAPTVNLRQTRFDYDGEYYYHLETGGMSSSGLALTSSVLPIGNDQYFVSFVVFCDGGLWENDALNLSLDEAWETFSGPSDFGHAIVHTTDLSDRSAYRMIAYQR